MIAGWLASRIDGPPRPTGVAGELRVVLERETGCRCSPSRPQTGKTATL